MKQQNSGQAAGKRKQIAALILSWLIILGTYLLVRIIFLVIGLHLYASALEGFLAIVPYALAAIYRWRSQVSTKTGFYVLGIMLPAGVEKIMLYFLAAFLYGVNPGNIAGILEKIAQKD